MNYKEEIQKILIILKKHDYDRRKIEAELLLSERYIDQQLSKGGNKTLYKKLSKLSEEVLQKATIPFDVGASVKKTEIMVDVLLSCVSELLAEKRKTSSALLLENLEAIVNARLNNQEPQQLKDDK